jgi:hypothetical protein
MKPVNGGMDANEYRRRLEQMGGQERFLAIRGHGRAMARTFKGIMPRKEAGRLGEVARNRS